MRDIPDRQIHLDGLRGVAATIVGVSLCAEYVVPPPPGGQPDLSLPSLLVHDFNMAIAGFVVLCALSGYLIPASIRGRRPLRDFILKRGLRLYPTFLVAGVAALCLLPLEPGIHPAARSFLKSFVTMRPLTISEQFNHSHWVLNVLMVFYALCFGAAGLGLLHKQGAAPALAFGLLVLCGVFTAIGLLYHRHFPILAILCLAVTAFGTFVRQEQDASGSNGRTTLALTAAAFWLALLLIVCLSWSPHWGMGEVWIGKALAFAAGGALFLYGVLCKQITAHPLVAIGDVSYALYFFLPMFLAVVGAWAPASDTVTRLAAAATATAVAFATSAITCRFVGKPAVDFGHRFVAEDAARAPGSAVRPSEPT